MDKVVQTRSPRAPRYSLRESVEHVRRIYDAVHRSAVDSHTAYQVMGFAGKSGSSATALGSVRQFGLIEGIGDRTRVSELALSILEPASEKERVAALQEALSKPAVFRAILERFENRIPPANEPLRAFLIRDLAFTKQGAEECIVSLRASIAEVGELASSPDAQDSISQAETAGAKPGTHSSEQSADQSVNQNMTLIRVPLTRECFAELRFTGELTDKALENLARHIDLMKSLWIED